MLIALGDVIAAVRLRAPIKLVSFTPLALKFATPATACIDVVPPIVASVEVKVTVCVASLPVVTVLPSWS